MSRIQMFDELKRIEGQRGALPVPLYLLKNGETLNRILRAGLDNLDNSALNRAAKILTESGLIIIRTEGKHRTAPQYYRLTDKGREFAETIDELERLLKSL